MSKANDYCRRINAVTNHVAGSLDRTHSIEELAAVAHFSKFHFHRIFHALTGETVARMVTRLRLEGAAATLIYKKDHTVTRVAMDHGYTSSANFTKAFTKHFGCPPSAYRSLHPRTLEFSKNGKDMAANTSNDGVLEYRVEIVSQPVFELAYLRRIGGYEHREIDRMHRQINNWVKARDCEAKVSMSLGITWSDSHIAHEERWRYDACRAVKSGTKGDGLVGIQVLKEGRIAQLEISLAANDSYDLSPHWNWFLGSWLPTSGHELADSPSYEIYDEEEAKDRFTVRLCLPLMSPDAEYDHAR